MSRCKMFSEQELLDLVIEYIEQTNLPLTWVNVIEWAHIQYPGLYDNLQCYHFSRFKTLQEYKKSNKERRLQSITDTECSEPTTQDFTFSLNDIRGKSPSEIAILFEEKNKAIMKIVKGSRTKEALIMKIKTELEDEKKQTAALRELYEECNNKLKMTNEENKVLRSSLQNVMRSNRELAGNNQIKHLQDIGHIRAVSVDDGENHYSTCLYSPIEAEVIKAMRGDDFIEQ